MILFTALSAFVTAQEKRDFVWVFGTASTDSDSKFGNIFMDFNDGKLTMAKKTILSNYSVTNTSISDQDGNLLFYTNGCYIRGASDGLMQNGDNLNPGDAYLSGNCPDYGNTSKQGVMVER